MIAGLSFNTGVGLWSLLTPPASSVIFSGATATASWQFVDEFPLELTDELHFILADSRVRPEASIEHIKIVSQPLSTLDRSIDAMGGPSECLEDGATVSLPGQLAKYDNAGRITAIGVNTRLTLQELATCVRFNCGAVIRDDEESSFSFTSKTGTHWKCLFIEGDFEDSFLLCEKIENLPGPHKNEPAVH